ncbi:MULTISPECIES: tetratricopeptide repeat protein [unclassified Streptomyces]|uniref:tetratricopeptide repeat protein n=1 Tax=unclassified Streptomyces TaxID=2593676 RepID=UPI002DDB5735|nr:MULTISPECIES: tetratricopeptide repeat protein [unclassified Streptomyces]WSB77449.1 tetratricopeptide repeat protein [Streptomyces sp. NBC_01775]WSS14285.1 tetratricopeptide repeat protein [Streptomyces sp. NBC_01186]WSS43103.1 tetratricopeptide repeat protein [Streptomyces sp. NBC_01187]
MNGHSPLVEKAELLLDADRPEEAATLLAQRIAEEPDDAAAWTRLVLAHLDTKEPERALEAARRAVELAPELPYAHRMLTLALLGCRRIDEAIAPAREAVRLEPESWMTHYTLAQALARIPGPRTPESIVACLEEALVVAREGVRRAPEEPRTHHQVAFVLQASGKGEEALAPLREALRLDPADARTRSTLVSLEQRLGKAKLTDVISAEADQQAAEPQNDNVRHNLDVRYHALLRRTRWIALLCLLVAVLNAQVYPSDDEMRKLPVDLGGRMYGLGIVVVICALTAVIAWRRLPRGSWRGMRRLCRRSTVVRLVPLSVAWCLLCAVALLVVAWTDRTPMRWITHAGWAVTLVAMYGDHAWRKIVVPKKLSRMYG